MGASSSKDSLADAVDALRFSEVAPSNGDGDVFAALHAAPQGWEELCDAMPAQVVREVRDSHPRNLAYLLASATSALELAVDADGDASAEARAAQAAGCLRLLARVVPFVAGDARLGAGSPEEDGGDAALAELEAYLAGGPLPAPRADTWPVAAEAAEAAEAAAAEQSLSAAEEANAATTSAAVGGYAAPTPESDEAATNTGEPAASTAAPQRPATPPVADAGARTSAASLGAAPLWQRIASAVAAAALCPELTLAKRASAWAPPLAPGSASLPPDAHLTPARLDALRCLNCLAAAEALYVPFAPPAAAADAPLAAPPPAASFLAAFAGRGAAADALPPGVTRRLFASLLNGASCAPGLAGDSPDGAALVAGCMRALLLLVSVADEDVPLQPPSAHRREPAAEDAPALFAAMALPQAACLHASLAAALATAASAAVAVAEWADVLAGVVPAQSADGETTQLTRTPPPGAAEAVALALCAAERAPAFSDVAAGRAGAGGWLLAGPVLVLMLVLRDEPSAAGLLRAGSFLLLNLGSSRAFGIALNEPLRASDAALASACGLGPPFPPGATRADALLAALACLLAYPLARGASIGRERPLYAPLLAVLLNAAPFMKGVTPPGAGAMMHLLASLAQPSVLLRDDSGAPLLRSVLDAMAATLTHQADANPALCGALLRHTALLRDLQELRLPDPQPEEASGEGGPPAEAALSADAAGSEAAPLFGGLTVVGPEAAAPAFSPDNAWLDAARAQWPLAELRACATALEPSWQPWLEANPGGSVYAEADFLRTLPLAGALPPPRPRPLRTYARTAGVASWQARHAAGLALLAEPAAVDGRRVRRLRVALR